VHCIRYHKIDIYRELTVDQEQEALVSEDETTSDGCDPFDGVGVPTNILPCIQKTMASTLRELARP
jgi:hypothetical protein